eukprot:1255311-Pyramimonas_sp.AAC.1
MSCCQYAVCCRLDIVFWGAARHFRSIDTRLSHPPSSRITRGEGAHRACGALRQGVNAQGGARKGCGTTHQAGVVRSASFVGAVD